MNVIQLLSILLEVIVVIIGVMIATTKKKIYGWLLSLTFFIYVFYDLSSLINLDATSWFLRISFFVASLSVTCAIYMIYKDITTK